MKRINDETYTHILFVLTKLKWRKKKTFSKNYFIKENDKEKFNHLKCWTSDMHNLEFCTVVKFICKSLNDMVKKIKMDNKEHKNVIVKKILYFFIQFSDFAHEFCGVY